MVHSRMASLCVGLSRCGLKAVLSISSSLSGFGGRQGEDRGEGGRITNNTSVLGKVNGSKKSVVHA